MRKQEVPFLKDDEVIIDRGGGTWHAPRCEVTRVVKVTPTGRFTVAGSDTEFNPDGYARGTRGGGYGRTRVRHATSEEKQAVAVDVLKFQLVARCRYLEVTKLRKEATAEELQAAWDALAKVLTSE